MSFSILFLIFGFFLVGILAMVWWIQHSNRGIEWIVFTIPLAFALSYLSSRWIQVMPYRAGCLGICDGWRGYPLATHTLPPGGPAIFDAGGFVLNAGIYYVLLLVFSALVLQLAIAFEWPKRKKRTKFIFVLLVVVLPLATIPSWAPTPEPKLPLAEQRLAINAARDWQWQLQASRFVDRKLAVEDVRRHPDGERYRVCFRAYSWFFIPSHHVYVDLEPAGVRATGGGAIPISASCWIQP
ncbi:MAG: hypothetical protein GXP38_16315 [Chloroflexi bacterium]|nr:hypothetical protein [Chloroflexota bacterium]